MLFISERSLTRATFWNVLRERSLFLKHVDALKVGAQEVHDNVAVVVDQQFAHASAVMSEGIFKRLRSEITE
jgi:hypothetical protein